jgi:hypothetical protein
MNNLGRFCRTLKKDFAPKIQDTTLPVRCWSEKDILDETIVDAYVIVLRTKGCSWALSSGCSMCGYFNDSLWKTIPEQDLLQQFKTALSSYRGEPFVKIFTSGSFLDDKEVSADVQKRIVTSLAKTTQKISVESRPEYITHEKIQELKASLQKTTFEIGIGLETANDFVRTHAINKGFTFKEYKKAVEILQNNTVKIKTYVLTKPPFLTEKEAIEDNLNTVKKIDSLTDVISFNPTNVQRNTVVEFLWKRKQYRPPWLWSVIEILDQSTNLTNAYIKCDVAGGGSRRGAHNCPNCNRMVLEAIKQFSLYQDSTIFKELSCECKTRWHDQLDLECMGFGSFVDLMEQPL